MGFPGGTRGKESTCQCRRHKVCGFNLWFGKIPWRRAWQATSVFLPGESHGQRSLAGCSPWGRKESDTTEHLSTVRPIPASVSRELSSHSLLLFPPQLPNVFFSFLEVSRPLLPFPHLSPLGAIDPTINPYETLYKPLETIVVNHSA